MCPCFLFFLAVVDDLFVPLLTFSHNTFPFAAGFSSKDVSPLYPNPFTMPKKQQQQETEGPLWGSAEIYFSVNGSDVKDLSCTLRSVGVELLSTINMKDATPPPPLPAVSFSGGGGMRYMAARGCPLPCPCPPPAPSCEAPMPCSAPGGMFQQQEAPQNGPSSDGEGSGGGDIQVRENFDPLAACLGFARTGVDGSVRITFKTPGSCACVVFPLSMYSPRM